MRLLIAVPVIAWVVVGLVNTALGCWQLAPFTLRNTLGFGVLRDAWARREGRHG